MQLSSFHEIHNHSLTFEVKVLTVNMLEDIKTFSKSTKVFTIKEFLEKKYKIQLDYDTVYRGFRKIFPRFGEKDGSNMLELLISKNIFYEADLDPENGMIKRLFFATPRMIEHYNLYGDINLIDSTYRVNHYNIPLIIYSGIDYAGKNIIFAVALVNDETEETRAWCFHQYFTLYKKLPNLIITDQDLALCAVLDKKYPNIIHLLCQWHIEQNLKKHFSFLLHMN